MSDDTTHCRSCGMTSESGPYCRHCIDESGDLQTFDERLTRMTQFMRRRDPSLTSAAAEQEARAYMATMPAWRDDTGDDTGLRRPVRLHPVVIRAPDPCAGA